MSDEVLLLDITTMITLISDISTDPNLDKRFGTVESWQKINKNIYLNILDEQKDPLYPKLMATIKGKKIVTTETAFNKFNEMIKTFGTPTELNNMIDFVKKIEIIKDDPHPSFNNFPKRYWSDMNIQIFGTAYKLGYTIVTGNVAVLKALQAENVDIKFIAHRPRCFVGNRNNAGLTKKGINVLDDLTCTKIEE